MILNYPDISIYKMLEINSKNRLNLTAYNYFGRQCSYKELLEQIEICAKALKAIGVKRNDKITICMPNTPEAIISFYAINKIGAIANMIHPLSAENEIKYYLNISNSKVLITVDLALERIKPIINKTDIEKTIVVSVKESMPLHLKTTYSLFKEKKPKLENNMIYWNNFINLGKVYPFRPEVLSKGSDEAVILYSGGTTGSPKGVVLTNLNFNALALQSIDACGCLKEKDRVLSIMPIFHGFGLGVCIHTVLNFGGCAVILPKFSAKTFDKLLKKYKPNVIVGVPTLYEALLANENIKKMDLSFLRCVISGGDKLTPSLKSKMDLFLKEHGANTQIREGYGLTECVTGSCLTPENYYKKNSIGIPYKDTHYKIVKPGTDEELGFNTDGEILVSGPTVMKGYLNNPEETQKVLKKHSDGKLWLYTGDVGFIDEDGFVYFKQRLKRLIVSSGYNIYPQQIENVLNSCQLVLNSCVVAKPHKYKGQVAKAFIIPKGSFPDEEKAKKEILEFCKKSLPKYSLPYEIEFIEEFPKTLVGKIAFAELEKREAQS